MPMPQGCRVGHEQTSTYPAQTGARRDYVVPRGARRALCAPKLLLLGGRDGVARLDRLREEQADFHPAILLAAFARFVVGDRQGVTRAQRVNGPNRNLVLVG